MHNGARSLPSIGEYFGVVEFLQYVEFDIAFVLAAVRFVNWMAR